MKTFEDYINYLREHRWALQSLTVKIQGIQHQIDELADLLGDESKSARELLDTADSAKPTYRPKIGAKHFRLLAILNHYGSAPKAHVAKILGMKESSVDQLACQIRKNHLGDLVSKKGVYTLRAMGDGVADSQDFKLV